jgi:hypothetical protein
MKIAFHTHSVRYLLRECKAVANNNCLYVTNHQTQSSVDGRYNRVVPLGVNVMSYVRNYRVDLDYQREYAR